MRRVLLVVLVSVLLLGLGGCWPNPGGSATPVAPSPTAQTLITVPDVTGHNAAVATDELQKLGFTNIDLGTVDGRAMVVLAQNWTVKTQSAKSGEQLPADAKIVLGCVRNG
jgi:hypothetical protein